MIRTEVLGLPRSQVSSERSAKRDLMTKGNIGADLQRQPRDTSGMTNVRTSHDDILDISAVDQRRLNSRRALSPISN